MVQWADAAIVIDQGRDLAISQRLHDEEGLVEEKQTYKQDKHSVCPIHIIKWLENAEEYRCPTQHERQPGKVEVEIVASQDVQRLLK
jgi:hypothetical protein